MFASLISPLVQNFAAACTDRPTFFGLKPWYQYLNLQANPQTGACEVTNFQVLGNRSDFLLIGLVIVDDLLRVAALVAVGFIIYGGITYVTSQGAPDQTSKAQQTIINALIGLVVSLIAVSLVAFLGNRLGG